MIAPLAKKVYRNSKRKRRTDSVRELKRETEGPSDVVNAVQVGL